MQLRTATGILLATLCLGTALHVAIRVAALVPEPAMSHGVPAGTYEERGRPAAVVPGDTKAAITERPLFSSTRRGPQPPVVAVRREAPPPPPRFDYRLRGTASHGGRIYAILVGTGGATLFAAEGDLVDDRWRVRKVAAGRLEIEGPQGPLVVEFAMPQARPAPPRPTWPFAPNAMVRPAPIVDDVDDEDGEDDEPPVLPPGARAAP